MAAWKHPRLCPSGRWPRGPVTAILSSMRASHPRQRVAVLAALFTVTALRAAPTGDWWNPGWEQRIPLRVPESPAAMAVPVLIPGEQLCAAGVPEGAPTGAFRVVGPEGELPSQIDERDGTGELVRAPNLRLDADDELVFVATTGPAAAFDCFLYFSRHPRPPGRYRTRLRYGRPSGAFKSAPAHGVFYDGDFKVAVKGPKLPDPTAHDLLNYCSGAISTLRWRGFDYVTPWRAWMWFIPRHPFGAGAVPVSWSLPEVLVDGPVRKTVRMTARAPVEGVREVRHVVSVFAGCATVDFEQAVEYADVDGERKKLEFVFPVRVTPDFVASAGTADGAAPCSISEEGRAAQAGGEAVALWNTTKSSDAEPWWSWYSSERRLGLAVFFAKFAGARGEALPRETWSASTYVRRNAAYTHFMLQPASGGVLRHTMRFSCVEEAVGVAHRFRVWAGPASAWAVFGEVEEMAAE